MYLRQPHLRALLAVWSAAEAQIDGEMDRRHSLRKLDVQVKGAGTGKPQALGMVFGETYETL